MTADALPQTQTDAAARREFYATLRKNARRTIAYALMIFLAFIFLFPIIFMIVASFKPDDRVIADLASVRAFLPDFSQLTLGNIENVFDRVPFERLVFNSLFVTFTTVVCGLFVNSMAAYGLSRLRWGGRTVTLSIVVSLIIIPLEAIAVPLMMQFNTMSPFLNALSLLVLAIITGMALAILWNVAGWMMQSVAALTASPGPLQLGLQAGLTVLLALPFEIMTYLVFRQTVDGGTWLNSYHVQILPFIAEPFSIFLFYQFFINIPKDFDEAAVVDGAGYLRIYWQIIVPLSRPVFATVAILKFLQFWSFYLWPLMVTREASYRPLMVGMDFFRTQQPIQWASIMAYASMVTIPVLIVFLLFQKWFVASVSSSGVKG